MIGRRCEGNVDGSGGDGGTVAAATAAAATNSGDNGSSTMSVASDRDLLGDWEVAQGQRWRQK